MGPAAKVAGSPEPSGVHHEIDGADHLDARLAWDDMRRENDLWTAGERVLRLPANDEPDRTNA